MYDQFIISSRKDSNLPYIEALTPTVKVTNKQMAQ